MCKETRRIVQLRNVFKSFKTGDVVTEVLKGVDLVLANGEFAVIFGPSGCGKTTLLNIIGALDTPSSGSVNVGGQELDRMNRTQLTKFRKDKIGFIFQAYNLLPTLTALENVEAALELLPFASRKEMKQRALDYLSRVELSDKADKFPAQLSGGEQQRVAIARALAKQPRLVLADEPTGNLDEATSERILGTMRTLNAETGATFAIVSHDPNLAELADRVVQLSDGKIESEKTHP
ncbi:MAG: ABC transporter ATP-binding protein [Candidatus Tritonobacter lacicola]|nr:ABC transporter ATP-binding protein [Candidatus Tritonobacter lacicola]